MLKRTNIIVNLCILLPIILFYCFIVGVNIEIEFLKKIILIQVIINILYGSFYSLRKQKVSIFLLFSLCNLIFLNSRVVLSLLENKILVSDWFESYIPNDETIRFSLKLLIVNNLGILLGGILRFTPSNKKQKNIQKMPNKIYLLLVISLIIRCVKFILEYFLVKAFNYEAIYLGESFQINILIKVISLIALALLPIFFAEFNEKKKVMVVISLYLISLILDSLKGGRGNFISGVFFVVWYFSNYYSKKIHTLKLGLVGISLIYFSQIMGLVRSGGINRGLYLLDEIKNFAYEQGVSLIVIFHFKEYPILLNQHVPYILGEIYLSWLKVIKMFQENINLFNSEFMSNKGILSHAVSYNTNKEMYLAGFGTGGNYILEMYDFVGFFGVLLLSFLLIKFLMYIEKNILNSAIIIRIFFIMIMFKVFLIPRTSYFNFDLLNYILILIIYLFLKIFIYEKER